MHLCFAPMDWITNCATRLITKEIFEKHNKSGDKLTLRTEFMNADWFLINPNQVIKHALVIKWQKPILQIYGWNENTLKKATEKIQNDYSQLFSWIELNTWCPSNTVMKVWGGSDMLKHKEKTLKIIQELSEIHGNLPFSLKTRTGLNDADKEDQMDFLIKASKYCAKISIHSRTLKQLYSGSSDRNFIREAKKNVEKNWNSECKIIGNWWVISYNDAKEKMREFYIDWIMIGQAAIWNPRIFTDYEPSLSEKHETVIQHLDYSIACDQRFDEMIVNNDWKIITENLEIPLERIKARIKENKKKLSFQPHTIVEFRKFLFQYVKWISWSKKRKQDILSCKNYRKLKDNISKIFESIR